MRPVVGQYKILERLGTGALGDVFRARDTRAGRTVALMEPPSELIASPPRRARFLEHARRAATLNHPNIAMLFDVIELDESCYLAYEFAAGPSLREEMGGAALAVREALRLAAQIADALAEGHAKGVMHGDLRPDTIVVTPKGSVKVLNFGMTGWTAGGVARVKAATAPHALQGDEAHIAGYLSPEQALGAAGDPRSDLFALGVIVYEMLTGRHPFAADTPRATIANLIDRAPALPSVAHAGLPPAIDRMVMRLLAKEAHDRYDTAAAAAGDIRRLAADLDGWADEPAREGAAAGRTRYHAGAWLALLALLALVAAVWRYLQS